MQEIKEIVIENAAPPATEPPVDFREQNEVSFRTVLIVPSRLVASKEASDHALCDTALVFGYRFLLRGAVVWQIIPPGGPDEVPYSEETEIRVENGDFVRYIIVNTQNQPLVSNGRPVAFVNPIIARHEAIRNNGQVKRADEWAKERLAQQKSGIIPATALPKGLHK